jgi:hypothetical protein
MVEEVNCTRILAVFGGFNRPNTAGFGVSMVVTPHA